MYTYRSLVSYFILLTSESLYVRVLLRNVTVKDNSKML